MSFVRPSHFDHILIISIQEISRILDKNFNFPKMHALLDHCSDHELRKGPIKDLNAIHGEHGHTVVKKDFESIRPSGDTTKQAKHHNHTAQ
jgi:hypothetical protein